MCTIRKSVKGDIPYISLIISKCFGERPEALERVGEGRYLVACGGKDGTPVAMTGICEAVTPGAIGYEVDWTACLPQFQRKGITTKLFSELLKKSPDTLYYSAWRHNPDLDHACAEHLLHKFGFKEVIRGNLVWNSGRNCCVYREYNCTWLSTDGECECYEDLWVRRGES